MRQQRASLIYVGVKPGSEGAAAAIDDSGRLIAVKVFDNTNHILALRELLSELPDDTGDVTIAVEQSTPVHQQASAVPSTIASVEKIEAFFKAREFESTTYSRKDWQAVLPESIDKRQIRDRLADWLVTSPHSQDYQQKIFITKNSRTHGEITYLHRSSLEALAIASYHSSKIMAA